MYGLCMGFGVHTALINIHPMSGSVEDGFEQCRSENRDRDRQRNRERHTVTEKESLTKNFCCDCTAVYPGLLLTITARAQATSSF